jgi:hypothetical protein
VFGVSQRIGADHHPDPLAEFLPGKLSIPQQFGDVAYRAPN